MSTEDDDFDIDAAIAEARIVAADQNRRGVDLPLACVSLIVAAANVIRDNADDEAGLAKDVKMFADLLDQRAHLGFADRHEAALAGKYQKNDWGTLTTVTTMKRKEIMELINEIEARALQRALDIGEDIKKLQSVGIPREIRKKVEELADDNIMKGWVTDDIEPVEVMAWREDGFAVGPVARILLAAKVAAHWNHVVSVAAEEYLEGYDEPYDSDVDPKRTGEDER